MPGRKSSGFFVSCCGRDGGVITPIVVDISEGTSRHLHSDTDICQQSKPNTTSSGSNNQSEMSEIQISQRKLSKNDDEDLIVSRDSQDPVNESRPTCNEMGDLESPHYVKRTAHIFQSLSSTHQNGNSISHTQINSPSYVNVSRSVSGYSCLSYKNSLPTTPNAQIYNIDEEFETWKNPSSSLFGQRSHSIVKTSLQSATNGGGSGPSLPKSAPPLSSPALVGQTMGDQHDSSSRSMILERIQRLYGKIEGESQTVFWKKKTPPRSPSPPPVQVQVQRIIPIQLEEEEKAEIWDEKFKSIGEDVVDRKMNGIDKIANGIDTSEGESKDEELSRKDENGRRSRTSLRSDSPQRTMSPVRTITKDNGIEEKDGTYFLNQVDQEKKKIEKLIEESEIQLTNIGKESGEEDEGKLRAAIGKARLLINKKFKQFEGLCHTNLDQKCNGVPPEEPFPTKNEDLEGFWDMVLIQVEHIHAIFKELDPNQAPLPNLNENQKSTEAVKKCPLKKGIGQKTRSGNNQPIKSINTTTNSKTDETRRKLLAEKRKVMKALATNMNGDGPSDEIQILSPPTKNH